MGLPSIDTYLHNEIEGKLKIILSNRYIIREILKGIQEDVARNFMRVYCGEKGREVPIVYEMPQDKITQQGAIYIGLREGRETSPSLGNVEGIYPERFKARGLMRDKAVIQATDEHDRLFLEVDELIGELINVENIAFSASDNVTIEDNRIYFAYDPDLIGMEFWVNYEAAEGFKNKPEIKIDEQGFQKGFTSTEHYSVLVISTNMDTVRCLDLIVKAILIMMRDNAEEQNNNLLQNLQFGQIEEIDTGRKSGDGETPELLYGRENIVTYTVSYNLDVPFLNQLREIEVNLKQGGE